MNLQKKNLNIPYKSKNGVFSLVNNIDKQIYIIIGSEDIGEKGEEYMNQLISRCKNVNYNIIPECNHNFKKKNRN